MQRFTIVALGLFVLTSIAACKPTPDPIAQCRADGHQICHKNCEGNECDVFCKQGTSGRMADERGPIGQCKLGAPNCENPC